MQTCPMGRPCEDREKTAIYTPRETPSEEISPADIFMLDFQLPEPWENNFCCVSQTVCGILFWQWEQTNTVIERVLIGFLNETLELKSILDII